MAIEQSQGFQTKLVDWPFIQKTFNDRKRAFPILKIRRCYLKGNGQINSSHEIICMYLVADKLKHFYMLVVQQVALDNMSTRNGP